MKLIRALTFMIVSTSVHSHSGGTDSYGCHTNHSTGAYHCHNSKSYKSSNKSEGRKPASIFNNGKSIKLKKIKSKN